MGETNHFVSTLKNNAINNTFNTNKNIFVNHMLTIIPNNHGLFKWIDIVDPTNEDMAQIERDFNLHPSSIIDSKQAEHLPKFETLDEDNHFIICRLYEDDCDTNADSLVSLTRKMAIFYGKDYLITIQRKHFEELEQVKAKYQNHTNVLEIVCKILKASFATFDDPIKKLDYDIDFFETRIFLKKRIPDLLKSLYLLKRRVYVFRKLFNLSKEIVDKMGINQNRSAIFQDMRDQYVKYDTLVEELHDSISSLLNIYISLSSQRTNEVMRVLTVFSAFFLPLTFIVGVYGMNFSHMPELIHPYGYLGVWVVMLIVTILIFRWFKQKGWI